MIHSYSDSPNQNGTINNSKGSVLIVTLLIITILTALVTDFVYDVYIDTSALSNWSKAQQATMAARSGLVFSSNYLSEIEKETYTDIHNLEVPLNLGMPAGTFILIKVEDENAKFNINSLIYENGRTNEKALSSLKKLLEYLNINPELALYIADWIDPDSEPRAPGSEDIAKNSAFWNIDELKILPDMKIETYNTLRPHITIFGDSMININTAGQEVLSSISNEITETMALQIIEYRSSGPFENKTALQNVPGFESAGISVLDRVTVKSSGFRITSKAIINDITRSVESIVQTSGKILQWREW
ncbi:MAG: type II secretion system minor pseudopilin GspK [Nitrospira sp.]|nr:type II secretion system minor pseudopilin GspK [Nitrospira sp.]